MGDSMSTYQLETEANSVFDALMAGVEFNIPDIDLSGPEYNLPDGADGELYKQISKLTDADLSTTFNDLMRSMKTLLQGEYETGRITGAEYTKAYVALVGGTLQNATQFLLGRDAAFWQAQQAQIAAITARVQLQTSKVQLASVQLEAQTAKAQYALAKSKLATESVNYGIATFNLSQLMPLQKAGAGLQNDMLTQQIKTEGVNYSVAAYNLSSILPAQFTKLQNENTMISHQTKLVDEQMETARAQTLDTRTDGQVVAGSTGQQKLLYKQQIVSYQRQSEVNAAKLFTDAWITQKTIDEGLTPPENFANASVNTILGTLKTNNSLG
ncbi:putative structural protein [Erwinia phage phiEaP8]|uniref:Putative structural protein n=1 Tax=Erwinia phage phiEaP8 TaxID=2178928 RepID=A0A3G1QTM5_9CAUD|nr:virion structural protein [Erwinia phage phiEaP8]AWN06206.1 putative structural protein [Erwinia phage phiEaP8]